MTGEWRRLHKEKLYALSSTNIIRVIKSRRIRWAGHEVGGGADKSLARPNSRCLMTESIVSLERGICSCAELKVFFILQRLKASISGDARDFNNIEPRAVIKFFFLFYKARGRRKFMPFCQTFGEHAPSYATAKNWVAPIKRGDFSTCDVPHPGRPKTVTTPEIIDQIRELILEDRRISTK